MVLLEDTTNIGAVSSLMILLTVLLLILLSLLSNHSHDYWIILAYTISIAMLEYHDGNSYNCRMMLCNAANYH